MRTHQVFRKLLALLLSVSLLVSIGNPVWAAETGQDLDAVYEESLPDETEIEEEDTLDEEETQIPQEPEIPEDDAGETPTEALQEETLEEELLEECLDESLSEASDLYDSQPSGTFWEPGGTPEDGDAVMVIVQQDSRYWALCAPEASEQAPEALEVYPENGCLADAAAKMIWNVSIEDGAMTLCSDVLEVCLRYTDMEDSHLGVGVNGDPYWLPEDGGLQSNISGCWLGLSDAAQWTVSKDPFAGQSLLFWYPGQTPVEPTDPDDESKPNLPECPYNLYFGQLHAHTALSDGYGDVNDAFQYASQVKNLDFFAVTDHSDSFDNAEAGSMGADASTVSQAWAKGKAAAQNVTGPDFVGIFGYEMSWQDNLYLGHIGTFATPGFQTREQESFETLEPYYEALTGVASSIGQFNHPGLNYADFQHFGHYDPRYDQQMNLLEVAGESGYRGYDQYIKALDAGWHVGPTNSQNNHDGAWGDANTGRTVLLADALTEESLYEAMRQRRVYATEDGNLGIYYTLNGAPMGSILPPQSTVNIYAHLCHPSEPIGKVEIVTENGDVIYSEEVTENEHILQIPLSESRRYYFLKITQADGDITVTAPVWMETPRTGCIREFTGDSAPVQGSESKFTLTFYNDSAFPASVKELRITVNGEPLKTVSDLCTVKPLKESVYDFTCTFQSTGTILLRAEATVLIQGVPLTWSKELTVVCKNKELTPGILVEESGLGSEGVESLSVLAARSGIGFNVFQGELPEVGNLLFLTPPTEAYTPEFVSSVQDFLELGGSLVVCGPGEEMNTLLEHLGSTMRLREQTGMVSDNTDFSDLPLCAGASRGQRYVQEAGCSVDQGLGNCLVNNDANEILLAVENTAWGGQILAAGGLFFTDRAIGLDDQSLPTLNQTILENLLGLPHPSYISTAISDVRKGKPGRIYRIRGHLTSGNTNPRTTFPGTLYIQDATGGIAVTGFPANGGVKVQIGIPLEITGTLMEDSGNIVLKYFDHSLLGEPSYRYEPRQFPAKRAMDYALNGGELIQVEGMVTKRTITTNGQTLRGFVLRDSAGDEAEVLVEPYIFSGSTGRNDLVSQVILGTQVRAIGILHMYEGRPVLRVRDCDEVTAVQPNHRVPDPNNPKTGDPFAKFWMFTSNFGKQ